jgi:hypothetical protein
VNAKRAAPAGAATKVTPVRKPAPGSGKGFSGPTGSATRRSSTKTVGSAPKPKKVPMPEILAAQLPASPESPAVSS